MPPPDVTTNTGAIESQSLARERRLAEDRLERFIESVRQMDDYIKQHRRHGKGHPGPKMWWPVRLACGLVARRKRDIGNQAHRRIRRG